MKKYTPQDHFSISGLFALATGSIGLGLAVGVLAYFISNIIYYLVLFPLAIGFLTSILYNMLILRSKVRNSILTGMFGIVAGFMIAASFYATPYMILRNKIVAHFQQEYQIDRSTASAGFDQNLIDQTGSAGFLGYMKLRATLGDEFTNYLIVNSMPVRLFSFSMKSTASWLYWLLETILFIFPCVSMGYRTGKQPFSEAANDWYETTSTEIGIAHLEDKGNLLTAIKANDLGGMAQLIFPEGDFRHPLIEIYRQQTKKRRGDSLLSLKQTIRKDQRTVKRSLVGQWEISKLEYDTLKQSLLEKKAEPEPMVVPG